MYEHPIIAGVRILIVSSTKVDRTAGGGDLTRRTTGELSSA